jgi:hypothetical protein
MRGTLKRFRARTLIIAAMALALVGVSAGTAYALVTNSTGTFTDRQYFATNDAPFSVTTAPGVWQNVPGMVRSVTVPAGTSRLLDARFTAESFCSGGSWCSVRIVYFNSAGATVELYPQAGTNYAFDSPGTDAWEGHALERNTRFFLGAGTYRVQVQATEVGASSFNLDDMHLAVEAIRP